SSATSSGVWWNSHGCTLGLALFASLRAAAARPFGRSRSRMARYAHPPPGANRRENCFAEMRIPDCFTTLSGVSISSFAIPLAGATWTASDTLAEHDRTTAYALLGFAYNPDAYALFAGIEKKYSYDRAPEILWRDLYTQYGAELLISGLFRPAVFAEWSPI